MTRLRIMIKTNESTISGLKKSCTKKKRDIESNIVKPMKMQTYKKNAVVLLSRLKNQLSMTRHSGFADGLEQVVFQPIGDGITQVAQHLDECRVVRFVEFLQIVFRVQIHGRVAPPLPFPQTHRLPLVLDLTEKA